MAIDFTGIPKGRVDTPQPKVGGPSNKTPSERAQTNGVTGSHGQDTVQLSAQAQSLQNLEQAAQQAPDIDLDKVDAIKRALDNGEYRIDNERLAQNLLDAEFDF